MSAWDSLLNSAGSAFDSLSSGVAGAFGGVSDTIGSGVNDWISKQFGGDEKPIERQTMTNQVPQATQSTVNPAITNRHHQNQQVQQQPVSTNWIAGVPNAAVVGGVAVLLVLLLK